MVIRSIGLATVIAAVSLATPGSSGTGTVSRCETVTVGSAAVVRSDCTASAGPTAVAGAGSPGDVVDVLSGILAGLPGLADRVAQAIPARQFGPWMLLMHF